MSFAPDPPWRCVRCVRGCSETALDSEGPVAVTGIIPRPAAPVDRWSVYSHRWAGVPET